MKIFNRGTDAKAAGPAAASAAVVPPAPAAPAVAGAPAAATPGVVGAPATAPAPVAPPAPPAPDLAVILDANVKEMSEKIARLASTLESSAQDRGSFEAKLEQMEERMRKLSSLTEMISAQYNPFVGDAPEERDPLPSAEIGLAAPPMPAPAPTPVVTPAPLPEAPAPAPAPPIQLALEPPALPEPDPFGEIAVGTLGAATIAEEPPAPSPSAPLASVPALSLDEPAAEPGVYLWSIPAGFESSMLVLGWADMLLKSAGSREALLDVVNYYHNIGWIGDPARDQILAYADGLTTPPSPSGGDWRASVETHERSLLFVEKLRAVAHRRS